MEATSWASSVRLNGNTNLSIKVVLGEFISKKNFPVLFQQLTVISESAKEPISPRCIELFAVKLFQSVKEELTNVDFIETGMFLRMVFKLFSGEIPHRIKEETLKVILEFYLSRNTTIYSSGSSLEKIVAFYLFFDSQDKLLDWQNAVIEVLKDHAQNSKNFLDYITGKKILLDFLFLLFSQNEVIASNQLLTRQVTLAVLPNIEKSKFALQEVKGVLKNKEPQLEEEQLLVIKTSICKHDISIFLICEFLGEYLKDPKDQRYILIAEICLQLAESIQEYECNEFIALLELFSLQCEEEKKSSLYRRFHEAVIHMLQQRIVQEDNVEFEFVSNVKKTQFPVFNLAIASLSQKLQMLRNILRVVPSENGEDLEQKSFALMMNYLCYFDFDLEQTFQLMEMTAWSFNNDYSINNQRVILKCVLYHCLKNGDSENLQKLCKKFAQIFDIDDRWLLQWTIVLDHFLKNSEDFRYYLGILIPILHRTQLKSSFSLLFIYINQFKESLAPAELSEILKDVFKGLQIKKIKRLPRETQEQILFFILAMCKIHKDRPKEIKRFCIEMRQLLKLDKNFYQIIASFCHTYLTENAELKEVFIKTIPFLFKFQHPNLTKICLTLYFSKFFENQGELLRSLYINCFSKALTKTVDYKTVYEGAALLQATLSQESENKETIAKVLLKILHATLKKTKKISRLNFRDIYNIFGILTHCPFHESQSVMTFYKWIPFVYEKKINFENFIHSSIYASNEENKEPRKFAEQDLEVLFTQMHYTMKKFGIQNQESRKTKNFALNLIAGCVETLVKLCEAPTIFPENREYLLKVLSLCFSQIKKLPSNQNCYFRAVVIIQNLRKYQELMSDLSKELPLTSMPRSVKNLRF